MTLQSVRLEPSACDAFRACEQTYCTDVCCEWVSRLHLTVYFLEFSRGNLNHHHFSDDVSCHELQLVCHCEVCHCEVEDEDAAACGFLRGLRGTAIQPCDRHNHRSFLLLRIADFVVHADVVDVSVSEFVLSPPGEHLAFSGTVLMHRKNLVAVDEVSGAHQHSNEEPNVWRSVIVQLV